MTRLYLALTILLLLMAPTSHAVMSPHIDSLRRAERNATDDSTRIELLEEIAIAYSDTAYDKAQKVWMQAITLAENSNRLQRVAKLYHNMCLMFFRQGELHKTLEILEKSLEIHEMYQDSYQTARVLNDIGLVYRTWAQYNQALNYYLRALELFEQVDDIEGIGMVSNNIGQIYYYRDDYAIAIGFFEKYLAASHTIGHIRSAAGGYNNIASAYMEMEQYNLALDHYLKAFHIYDSIGLDYGIALINDNIGTLFTKTGEYSDALLYHFNALDVFTKLNSSPRVCHTLKNIGLAYKHMNDTQLALKYLKQSKEIALEHNLNEILAQVCLSLSDIFMETDKPYKAIDHYKEYIRIKDSLQSIETAEKLTEIHKRYQLQQSTRNETHTKEQVKKYHNLTITLTIIGLLLATALLIAILLSVKRGRKTAEIVQKHRVLTRSILSTHTCNPLEHNLLGHIGWEFFAIPKYLCDSSSCMRVVTTQTSIAILSIHFDSKLGLTNLQKKMILLSINSLIANNSEDQSLTPDAIVAGINRMLTSNHIETTDKADDSGIRLGCFTIDRKAKNLSYYGNNPAWIVSHNNTIQNLKQAQCGNNQAKPKSECIPYTNGTKVYLFATPNTQFVMPQSSESIDRYLERTLTALSKTPFNEQNEVIESSIEFWRNSFGSSNPLLCLAIKL